MLVTIGQLLFFAEPFSPGTELLQTPSALFLRTVKHAIPRKFVMSLMTRYTNRAYSTKERKSEVKMNARIEA